MVMYSKYIMVTVCIVEKTVFFHISHKNTNNPIFFFIKIAGQIF